MFVFYGAYIPPYSWLPARMRLNAKGKHAARLGRDFGKKILSQSILGSKPCFNGVLKLFVVCYWNRNKTIVTKKGNSHNYICNVPSTMFLCGERLRAPHGIIRFRVKCFDPQFNPVNICVLLSLIAFSRNCTVSNFIAEIWSYS